MSNNFEIDGPVYIKAIECSKAAISIELSTEELATIALAAHQANMTLNDWVCLVIKEHLDNANDKDVVKAQRMK